MSRNIELKARVENLDAAREIAHRLGAERISRFDQWDTFFPTPEGRLKLRKLPDAWELIAYHRSNDASARPSDYEILRLEEGEILRSLLSSTLGFEGEVRKTRELFLWKDVRIHMDEVDGIGTFLEFEALVNEKNTEEDAAGKIYWLTDLFQIEPASIESVSYLELLAARVV